MLGCRVTAALIATAPMWLTVLLLGAGLTGLPEVRP